MDSVPIEVTMEVSIEVSMEVYTDGACKRNPGPGGWGIAILENGKEIYHAFGGELETTNNRMEITAIMMTLKLFVKKNDKFFRDLKFDTITIVSDSMLCLQTIAAKPSAVTYFFDGAKPDGWMKKWKTIGWKDKKNVDLWKKVDKYLTLALEMYPKRIGVRWVKGHNADLGNELADKYANEGVVYEL
ncbi:MAG: ribonuclease HI [Acetobacteraceae bacterium]|nr:ribonuclease HI [Acetobacteraceae bacterium]